MRRLYLHVGTHKTGTTSLQAYLLDHLMALQGHNIVVLTENHRKFGKVANCLGFAHGILRDQLRSVARMTGDMPRSASVRGFFYRRHIRNQLRRLPDNATAVLSAEALCFARKEEEADCLRKVIAGLDLEVIVVICFRNETDWRESWNSELQAWANRMDQSFGEGLNDIRSDWYFDRESILSFWMRFGEVRSVDFDASVANDGSILPKLLDALEVPAIGKLESFVLRRRQ